jgi:Na+-translocating ferredoxin:NAD+ oxidoreductase RnfA subunit
MTNTALLIIFTGFSVNLVVQFGFGVRDILSIKQFQFRFSFYQGIVLFLSVIVTWAFFHFIIFPLGFGFLETLLLLPLSILFASLIEKGIVFICSKWIIPVQSSVFSAYNGLVLSANFFVLRIAQSIFDASIMSASFSLGYLLSMFIVFEIYKNSSIEEVPPSLCGAPLLLISLGLLSLVCSAAAVFFLQMIELF